MMQKKKVLWKCLIGGAKKWKDESLIKMIKMIESDSKEVELVAKKNKKVN
jgi:S-adenosylmethionine:tRNA ribosyltransferase-isomerase